MSTLNQVKRVVTKGIKGGVPLDQAFRNVRNGGMVQINVTPNKYIKEGYVGLVRVLGSQAKPGRPSKLADKTPEFPTGSMSLTLECLDNSGRKIDVNWRRDHDSIHEFNVQLTARQSGVVGAELGGGIRTNTVTYGTLTPPGAPNKAA